jgi:hypothetical protein
LIASITMVSCPIAEHITTVRLHHMP